MIKRLCNGVQRTTTHALAPSAMPPSSQLNIPELCVTTPFFLTSSIPLSSTKRSTAWNAPLTLNAPIFWKFSALKNSLILGFAGSWPSHCVSLSAAGLCGVDARLESVVLVSTGVVWMWGLMRLCAATMESRVNGKFMVDILCVLRHRVRGEMLRWSAASWWAV